MSHSSSPRRGDSDDSVTARISRLVIWPSCSNSASGRPAARARMRAPARRLDLQRNDVERVDAVKTKIPQRASRGSARAARRALPAPSAATSRIQLRAAAPPAPSGPSPSDVSARMRAPGCRCGRIRSSGRPCSESSVVSGSGQPSRAAARLNEDGAGSTSISVGVDMARQQRADAVEERIAGRQHADRPAALLHHLADGALERARPRPHRPADERGRKLQMALAAEHDLGVRDQPARDRAQALDAVLADADDGQPAARCGSLGGERTSGRHATYSHTRRHERSAATGGPLAGPARPQGDAFAGRPHRPACRPAGSGADRRIRRHRGACGLSHRERIDVLIDATHPYAATISAHAAEGRAAASVPILALRRPAWTAVAGDRWIEVDDIDGAVRALGASPRRVFLADRPEGGRCLRGRPAARLSGPQRRSGRSAARGAARALHRGARTVRGSRRARAADASTASKSSSPRTAAASATYGKIAAARALGIDGDHAAPAGAARRAGGRDASPDAVAWLDHALASGADRGV